jgi:hypothetical protein
MISSSKQGFKGEVGQIFQKTLAPVCLDSVHVFQHIIRGRRVKMEGKAPHIANSEQKCVQFQKEQHAFSPSLGRHPQRTIKNPPVLGKRILLETDAILCKDRHPYEGGPHPNEYCWNHG